MYQWVLPFDETSNEDDYIYFHLVMGGGGGEKLDRRVESSKYPPCLHPSCFIRSKTKRNGLYGPSSHIISHDIGTFAMRRYYGENTIFQPRCEITEKSIVKKNYNKRKFILNTRLQSKSVFHNPYIYLLYRVNKCIFNSVWDTPEIWIDQLKSWEKVINWKINRENGTISHKACSSVIKHQYLNNVDLSIIRVEFNCLVVYVTLKMIVLLRRARARLVKWKCLRMIYKRRGNNNSKLFNRYLGGGSNIPIRYLIFKVYL